MARARLLLLASLLVSLASCSAIRPYGIGRVLEGGDCESVPDIERLTITISDHGTLVSFRWQRARFAGLVLTGRSSQPRDASNGVNVPGEWERRFPKTSATETIAGSFLGFPAAANASASALAATVYEAQYPPSGAPDKGFAIVDLKTQSALLVADASRVASLAWAPKGEYVAVVAAVPTTAVRGWRDLFAWSSSPAPAQYDVVASVYHVGGLLACTRKLAGGVPAPAPNVVWE